ncbi:DUF262 domain-containing protein [Hymenobacter elongatus]|uniref:DUF262 domain-containing protein n=1 Tax=Hymenobacter elongatus TaxID=877208 RepID=UPI00143699BF|nr:DUF262 domain-containing protein [Hymenobacter elongatus]
MLVNPENTIGLKSIADLAGLTFLVPPYQRGYRWTEVQVTELLDDLLYFGEVRERSRSDTFYCLQPVLIKPLGRQEYELIDGQQRLTTLHLLYGYIRQQYQRGGRLLFTLRYVTRPDSQRFLEALNDPAPPADLAEQAKANIDFTFMHQAWESLEKWFKDQPDPALTAIDLYQTLLKHTQLIWYELPETGGEQGQEQQAFIRLNSGKIPLTNAELIKALFLKRAADDADTDAGRLAFERRQLELAADWDRMEVRLRQEELWFFLNQSASRHPTRIEFLFELHKALTPPPPDEQKLLGNDAYATFRYFNHRLQRASKEALLTAWGDIKDLFLTLEDWYASPRWYHQLGYLIAVGTPLTKLLQAQRDGTKREFAEYVREEIRCTVAGDLTKWEYGADKTQLRNVLLLFNIETLHAGGSYRFPFQHYKSERHLWSLEHIHAQNDKGLRRHQDFVNWLGDVRPYVAKLPGPRPLPEEDDPEQGEGRPDPPTAAEVLERLNRLAAKQVIEKEEFKEVQLTVLELLGEPNLHGIENLALLSTQHNAVLSNGVFAQKRQRILNMERAGEFVPIATRNVFLKYYTQQPDHLSYWTATDRAAYIAEIRRVLVNYLTAPHDAD